MDRAGHRTAKAAILHQHVGAERGQVIAAGIDAVLAGGSDTRYGTQMARSDEDELPLLPLLAE
ncbi:hypothetical protein [Rathayibacter tritici]|nr:hypothetical protein [Rathayibacter tritici]PPI45439.1 hypothetical protein C5D18_06400 [Rathayibacter tritici]